MLNASSVRNIIIDRTALYPDIWYNVYRLLVKPKIRGSLGNLGSGFTVFHNKKVYLVTASHLFDGIHENDVKEVLYIFHNKIWNKVKIEDYKAGDSSKPESDIAVLKVDSSSLCREISFGGKYFTDLEKMMYESVGIGTQIIFAGYPHLGGQVNYNDETNEVHQNFPRPFLKFGYLSHFTIEPDNFFIDGAPNKGFSGGPVMYRDEDNKLRYIGIVSSGSNDMGLGAFTMTCGNIHKVMDYIKEM